MKQLKYENKNEGFANQKLILSVKDNYVEIIEGWNKGAKFPNLREAKSWLRDYGFTLIK